MATIVSRPKIATVTMTFHKSTKGTHVYHAPDTAITSLYIDKGAFAGDAPKTIIVAVVEGK